MPRMTGPSDVRGIQAVERALTILDKFGPQSQVLGVRDLADDLSVHQSTLYRLLGALHRHGLINWQDGKVRPGLRLYELGCLAVGRLSVKPLAQPILFKFAADTEETLSLGIYDRGQVLYLERVESPRNVPVVAVAGGRGPVHCTGTGKVLLAAQTEQEVDRVISCGLRRFTQFTVTDGALLRKELAKIRQEGHAISDQELQLGDYAIAAPVYDSAGTVVAAISLSGAVSRISRDQGRYLQAVLDAAAELSKQLGHLRM